MAFESRRREVLNRVKFTASLVYFVSRLYSRAVQSYSPQQVQKTVSAGPYSPLPKLGAQNPGTHIRPLKE